MFRSACVTVFLFAHSSLLICLLKSAFLFYMQHTAWVFTVQWCTLRDFIGASERERDREEHKKVSEKERKKVHFYSTHIVAVYGFRLQVHRTSCLSSFLQIKTGAEDARASVCSARSLFGVLYDFVLLLTIIIEIKTVIIVTNWTFRQVVYSYSFWARFVQSRNNNFIFCSFVFFLLFLIQSEMDLVCLCVAWNPLLFAFYPVIEIRIRFLNLLTVCIKSKR